jgi:hypothetical protein
MRIGEKIFVALGVGSFLFSSFLFLLMRDHEYDSGWFAGLNDLILRLGSSTFAVIGLCLLLFGLYQLKQARDTRKFDEAMKAANTPRKDA